MKRKHPLDHLSLGILKEDLKGYNLSKLWHDLSAGLTVALLSLPQAMAYALVADLPLSCGLFAAIFSTIVAAAFCSSRYLLIGPSFAIAILVQSATAQIIFTHYRHLEDMERIAMSVQIMTQLCLMVGLLQLLAAFFRLGRLTQFVSHSVIVGYLAGTSLAIVVNQLFVFLGIPMQQGSHSFYDRTSYLITNFDLLHGPTALAGLASLVMLLILRRINPKIPSAVIVFTIIGAVVYYFGLSLGMGSRVLVVGDSGSVFEGLPWFLFPHIDMKIVNLLLPTAFAITLMSIMETISVSKSMAATTGEQVAINQDIFGLSLGNVMSSLIAALPVSGSASRSALSYTNGAKTRFASLFSGLCFILILSALNFLVTQIPLTALAALLLVTATNVVNKKQLLLCLKATSADALVFWVTFSSCIFFSLSTAFYIGVIVSITLYLKKAALPQLKESDVRLFWNIPKDQPCPDLDNKEIRVIKVQGELFFGSADLFQTTLKTLAEGSQNTRVLLLQMKNARDIDATTCLALNRLSDYLRASDRFLICCGLTPQIWEVFSNSEMVDFLGKENLFLIDERHPHLYKHKALERARELIAQNPLKSEPVPEEVREEGLATELASP